MYTQDMYYEHTWMDILLMEEILPHLECIKTL